MTNQHLKLVFVLVGVALMIGAISSPYIVGIGAIVVFFIGWQITEKSYESFMETDEDERKLAKKERKEPKQEEVPPVEKITDISEEDVKDLYGQK